LIHQLRTPTLAVPGASVSSSRFRADVRNYGVGADRDIPHLSASFIRKCLDDLRLQKLL
jgi:fatty acid CoA ligase FadD9